MSWPEGTYLMDRERQVWLVTSDGAMVTRAAFEGIESAGTHWLQKERGPVYVVDLDKGTEDDRK